MLICFMYPEKETVMTENDQIDSQKNYRRRLNHQLRVARVLANPKLSPAQRRQVRLRLAYAHLRLSYNAVAKAWNQYLTQQNEVSEKLRRMILQSARLVEMTDVNLPHASEGITLFTELVDQLVKADRAADQLATKTGEMLNCRLKVSIDDLPDTD